jgi:hypothetical protein
MRDSFNIDSPSPNKRHIARFLFGGEIRFGPPYYALALDDYAFGERIFGAAHLWSPSSNIVAVLEWLTLDYSEGPITALIVLDLDRGREAPVARATKAFIVPLAFDGSSIVYREDRGGQEGAERFGIDITKIDQWSDLARAK